MDWVWLIVLVVVIFFLAHGRSANSSGPSVASRTVRPEEPTKTTIVAGTRAAVAPKPEEWSDVINRYSLRPSLFNRSEGHFYRALRLAAAHNYFIFAKVRLLDICDDIPGRSWSAMNRISAKHVDFVLCDPATLRPLVAFEVDGPSHTRRDRVERDAFVDAFFDQIGLPLVRVPANSWFEPADLSRRIDAAIGVGATQPVLLSQNA